MDHGGVAHTDGMLYHRICGFAVVLGFFEGDVLLRNALDEEMTTGRMTMASGTYRIRLALPCNNRPDHEVTSGYRDRNE